MELIGTVMEQSSKIAINKEAEATKDFLGGKSAGKSTKLKNI